jgi:hypothetical protein
MIRKTTNAAPEILGDLRGEVMVFQPMAIMKSAAAGADRTIPLSLFTFV